MTEQHTQKEYWSGKVGGEWASHAALIDAMLRPMTDAALAAAAFRPGERVLDIGCGAGATSLAIGRAVHPGGAVTGVDISPPLLNAARARAADTGLPVEFVEADAGEAKFGRPFDAAFSRFGVMFFEHPAAAFANIRGELREGGRLVFLCWRPFAENTWSLTPLEAVKPMLKAPLPEPDPDAPGPFALADARKIERVLSEAGWKHVSISRWDGDIAIGGGGSVQESADFMLRIGPCARAIADQELDVAEVRRRLIEALAPLHTENGVASAAACWLVQAVA